jgi:hypothetical protein
VIVTIDANLRDLEAAIDGAAILAELGVAPEAGTCRVIALPCDGGYVVNVCAAGVVTAERAAEVIAGHRRLLAMLEALPVAEADKPWPVVVQAGHDSGDE